MRLKKIEMQGFKSFPDKTIITFDKGLTVIVGPNGSGKSNISDAMKWVLGEISPKSLRGSKMEDVIFAGSQKRNPMNYAEVSVTFDNTDPDSRIVTDEDYDDITVTRRFYRVGEGEYFINKKQVRQKDVHELFMNTGLGRGGYSIIGQGKIAEIISKKNEERRAVFEEAAGIAKYKHQKMEAERNLAQTNDNLTRLEDIVGELKSRVGPLEKDSEKAKKYLELYEKKKEIDISLSLYDIDDAKENKSKLDVLLNSSKLELENIELTLEGQEQEEKTLTDAQTQARNEMESINDDILASSNKKKDLESSILVMDSDNSHYFEQKKNAQNRLKIEEADIKKTEAELSNKKEELNVASEKMKSLEKDLEEIENQIKEIEDKITISEFESEETTKKKVELSDKVLTSKLKSSAMSANYESDKKKVEEIEEQIKSIDGALSEYDSKLSKLKKKIDSYNSKLETEKESFEKTDKKASDIQEMIEDTQNNKNDYYLEISQRKHKVQNLIRMDELLEGFSRSIRFVMEEYGKGSIQTKDGKKAILYGPLSKLIETEDKYSTALEIAFGANLQNIVTEDEASAKGAIEFLKKKNAGRATFYPVDTMIGDRANDATYKDLKGYVAVASDLVKCDKKYEGIVRSLVGRIIVADNLENASNMAKKNEYRIKIVTLDGQVINAGGSFTGGSVNNDSKLLSRKSEIDRLNKEISDYEKLDVEAEEYLNKLSEDKKNIESELKEIRENINAQNKLLEAENTEYQIIKSSKEIIEGSKKSALEDIEKLTQSISEYENEIKTLEDDQNSVASETTLLDVKEEELRKVLDTLDEEYDEKSGKRSDILIEIARAKGAIERLSSIYDAINSKYEIQLSSIDSLNETIRNADEKIQNNGGSSAEINKKINSLKTHLEELEKKKAENQNIIVKNEEELAEIRTKEKNTLQSKELASINLTKIEAELENAESRSDQLINFLWDDYELSYSAAKDICKEPLKKEDRGEAVSLQQKYKNQIKYLGNVNVGAIEEYKEVSERYNAMSIQIQDLYDSRDSLNKNISELESQMCEDFVETIKNVNINFSKVFTELFGGGHAEISLSDPEHVLESGIDINVAPPGKVIKSLSLLSGGEQAFVAIALYFAILKVNPSPFCIMDEIEAALDEVNVDKFADYVKNYSEKTQFILITHRRGTMEVAERLYGVTMHEKGISDIMSVDVSEVEQRLGKDLLS